MMRTEPIGATLGTVRHYDPRGDLEVIPLLPFPAVRVFAMSSVPIGQVRGAHWHQTCRQVIWCPMGRAMLTLQTGRDGEVQHVELRPGLAVDVPPLTFIELWEFSQKTLVVVAASEPYQTPGGSTLESLAKYRAGLKGVEADAGVVDASPVR